MFDCILYDDECNSALWNAGGYGYQMCWEMDGWSDSGFCLGGERFEVTLKHRSY